MANNAVVRSRVSLKVKEDATNVLSNMGLTVSDVVRIVLTRVANEKTLPFDLVPNAETRASMAKTMRGEGLTHAKDAKELFKKLGI